jgi:hypothetical protein
LVKRFGSQYDAWNGGGTGSSSGAVCVSVCVSVSVSASACSIFFFFGRIVVVVRFMLVDAIYND